jgi:hypothetical protein
MTAEGDNSVLMQKVAKERLTSLTKSGQLKVPQAPANKDISNRVRYFQNILTFKTADSIVFTVSIFKVNSRTFLRSITDSTLFLTCLVHVQEYMMYLLNAREMKLFTQLAEKMAKAGKEGMFQTW